MSSCGLAESPVIYIYIYIYMRIEIDFGEKCIHQNLKMHTKDQTGSIYILYKLWQTHHLTERSLSLSHG